MSETLQSHEAALYRKSQIFLNKGVIDKLAKWQVVRELTDEERVYLGLAQLTLSQFQNQERDEAAKAV